MVVIFKHYMSVHFGHLLIMEHFLQKRHIKCSRKTTTHTCSKYCTCTVWPAGKNKDMVKIQYTHFAFSPKKIPRTGNDRSYYQQFFYNRPHKKSSKRWPLTIPDNHVPNMLVTANLDLFNCY